MRLHHLKTWLVTVFLCTVSASSLSADVKLPALVCDGMVLQRDAQVRIWGWASKGEEVRVHFIDSTYRTIANSSGDWEVMLPKLKAGGPYAMRIDAHNSLTISDILVGDVWVCSGQSNMQMGLGSLAKIYPDEIAGSENHSIRQFTVPIGFPCAGREKDLKSGKWRSADPQSVRGFTAAGYFFAKKLFDIYKIPIGLINASLGGSSAEAWISEESIASFPKYFEDAQRFKHPELIERLKAQDDERVNRWMMQLRQSDEGFRDPQHPWSDPATNTSDWDEMHLPGYWTETALGSSNGVAWFRKEVTIPPSMAGKQALIHLGRIFDIDSVFLNGKCIGTTGSQYAPRVYAIPTGVLTAGINTIVIRDISLIRHGGFVPGKLYAIIAGTDTLRLEGEWKYKRGATLEPLEDRLFTGKIPTGLFNAMIAPVCPYVIKGVVWYQGESNTSRAFEHLELFKTLIRDWRENWRQGNFPFLFVQLPNFIEVNVEETKYDWAFFRESQLKALSIPNTAMAVTIDIGEGNDIHPTNKKDVGYRLALAARKIAYGDKSIVASGPIYRSMKISGKQIIVSFTDVGTGLVARNSHDVKWVEICGADNVWVPGRARIKGNTIIVSSDKVSAPVAVRYAWSNNPEGANLYNKEGLPASPFRTDCIH